MAPWAAQSQSLQGLSDARKATDLVCPESCRAASCAAPTMALAHVHTARRLHFSASSDGLLLWLSEECWGRGLIRVAELLGESGPQRPEVSSLEFKSLCPEIGPRLLKLSPCALRLTYCVLNLGPCVS